ncbi:hypothetical protein GQX74_005888 [Glossina fuscipes]|nr:hypothetical protein GQX74_005888 [Glossina fuscipes]
MKHYMGSETDIRGVVIAVGINENNGNRLSLVLLFIDELFVLFALSFLSILVTDEFSGDNNVSVADMSAGFSFVVVTTALGVVDKIRDFEFLGTVQLPYDRAHLLALT